MEVQNKKKNNRGFTLIELIVSLAVASIVILAIGTLLSIGTRSYYMTSTETELQKEAQIAINQINDLMMKAQEFEYLDIPVIVDGIGLMIPTLVITGSEEGSSGLAETYYYALIFDLKRNQLLFSKKSTSSATNKTTWLYQVVKNEVGSSTPSLLAKYIKELTISPENSTNDVMGIVQITLDLELGEKTYSTFSSISLRNK